MSPEPSSVTPPRRPGRSLWMALGIAWVLVVAVATTVYYQFLQAQHRQAARRVVPAVEMAEAAPAASASDAAPRKSLPFRPVPGQPGIQYANEKMRSVPWSIHVVQVDRSRSDLGFYSAHAGTKVLGVALLEDQAAGVPASVGKAVVAINGDFYDRDNRLYAGDPRGLQIIQGELTSAPHTVCTWFDAQGQPHLDEVKGDFAAAWPDGTRVAFGLNQRRMDDAVVLYAPSYGPSTRTVGGTEVVLEREGNGPWLPLKVGAKLRAKVRSVQRGGNTPLAADVMVLSCGPGAKDGLPATASGEVLELSFATTPDLPGAVAAMAGGPAIVQQGKPFAQGNPPPGLGNNYSERSKYERHPRSAIGWNKSHFYFVTVDGRQPGLSVGMKLAELGEYLAGLGCTEGMNLDGGKSAQLWLDGRTVNNPCQGEDTVANSLMVIRKPAGR